MASRIRLLSPPHVSQNSFVRVRRPAGVSGAHRFLTRLLPTLASASASAGNFATRIALYSLRIFLNSCGVGVFGGQTNFWPYMLHPVLHFSNTRSSTTTLAGVTILA